MRLLLLALCALPLAAGTGDSFLLRGATVHPVTGPAIENGAVLVKDGRIAGVGTKLAAPKGVKVIEARGLHVYPGLIDSGGQLGAVEISSLRETNDTTEIGQFKPQIRMGVAVNPTSEHIPVTRSNGITTALTMPSGGIIAGQATLMHLDGWTTEDMAVKPSAAMRIEFPALRSGRGRYGTFARTPFAELKKQYEAQLRELDEFFESARRYQQAKAAKPADFKIDLKFEAMLPLLEGKLPALISAAREKDIRAAIAFAGKQKIKMILQSGSQSWKLASELKAKNIPVTLAPTLALPDEEDDPYDQPFTTPGQLQKAGVKIAFCSLGPGGSNPFNLPYQAAGAVPFGLPADEALKAITINAAEIFGVADEIGSIDKGKWADLIVTDGDPLEIRTQVKQMFIKGRAVDLDNKHKQLYQKYLARP